MVKKSTSKLPVATPSKPVPVKIVSESPSTDRGYEEREKKWRAESDLRTLKDAAEIQRDKERMKAAKTVAKQEMNSLKKIC